MRRRCRPRALQVEKPGQIASASIFRGRSITSAFPGVSVHTVASRWYEFVMFFTKRDTVGFFEHARIESLQGYLIRTTLPGLPSRIWSRRAPQRSNARFISGSRSHRL